jgi:hypothetical protein
MRQEREMCLRLVEAVGQSFTRPEEDWLPALLLLTPEGMTVVGITLEESQKGSLKGVVGSIVRTYKPTFAALVLSCWIRDVPQDNPLAGLDVELMGAYGVSTHPQRREMLMVEMCDGTHTEYWEAPIIRYNDRPPTLGAWGKARWQAMGGRMANVLRDAFRGMRP